MPLLSRRAKGQHAEDLAVDYLQKQGIKIITRNFSARGGELDIIGRSGNELRVVEVRSRNEGSPYIPEASLSAQKITRLRQTVQKLRQQYRLPHVPIRMDLLVVDFHTGEIKYYPGGIVPAP